jgi:hypothetical protein
VSAEGVARVEARFADGPRLREPRVPDYWTPSWHALSLMTVMRVGEAVLWPDPFAETRLAVIGEHYAEAFTRPPVWDSGRPAFEWDGDPWPINVVGHALLGAELYYRPRACGHGALAALGFAVVGAAVWDYGFEASGVRPSGLDLWYTPLSGALLGEARYWVTRSAGGIDDPTIRGIVRTLFDPLGEFERALGAPC